MIVGVISDTHGLLRAEVISELQGCDHIIHAGDVGDPQILEKLRAIAPLSVVRGNIDKDEWARSLPDTDWLTLDGQNIFVLHDSKNLDLNAASAGLSAVISGHTHQPLRQLKNGVLYLNPGSVGPRRFSLPISMAKLTLVDATIRDEFIRFDL